MTNQQLIAIKAQWADAMWEASQASYSGVQDELCNLLVLIYDLPVEQEPQPLWRSLDVTLMCTSSDREHPYYSNNVVMVSDGKAITVAIYSKFDGWYYDGRGIAFVPTHWAPLPKLPEATE